MKTLLILACVLGLAPSAFAAGSGATGWAPAVLPQSVQRDLPSHHTGRSYRIFVSKPSAPAPATGYPVIYVLDGNAQFPLLALQARAQEKRAAVTGQAPTLVVGIGYPIDGLNDEQARAEDYTPPAADLSDTGDEQARRQGGADRFLAFVEDELKPLIERSYPVDRQRQTLFGHSYGGLFTLHTLFTRPQAFQTYLAISPSIWWNHRQILDEQRAFAQRLADRPQPLRLFLGVGALEQPSPLDAGGNDPRRQRLDSRRMVDNVRELAATLAPLERAGLRSQLRIFPDEGHGTTALVASGRALGFAAGQPE
ncbi:alpha/beta hydrolase [Pseudomonas mangiferae]|uniref:Alpha/beta hydrolase n=1 Tax=Pseudomonas mangiferae TaxID=2593654 RepID=A0A553GW01_9PSED|nr:alpha/beta hydrolase-fold protein [Pseudomonas mangiferae]TRX73698.1 alpha/beta hydrolase [Pseudomonas mangiferae]